MPSSSPKSWRVAENDALPKTMKAREWVELVTQRRPPHPKVAGVIAFDCGRGPEACLLGWTGRAAIAAPLAALDPSVAALFPGEAGLIATWRTAAARGDYAAAIARRKAA